MMLPITVRLDDGGKRLIYPARALAAIEEGPTGSRVWHFDVEGFIEETVVLAELSHVRAALGLDDIGE